TLTETLMEEEARHNSDLGYKTASSYMFGAEMSSGFGSARGGGSGFGSSRSTFFPTSTGVGVTITIPSLPLKDLHETFKIDRYDNIYGGHTSITSLNNTKKRFNW
ncbi:MAG: hypothetical protein V1914_01945, partial [archaeon]